MGTPKKIPQLPQKTTAINNDDKYIIEDSVDNKTKFIRAQDMLSYFSGVTPNLNQVLTQGNDANNQKIINLGNPINPNDASRLRSHQLSHKDTILNSIRKGSTKYDAIVLTDFTNATNAFTVNQILNTTYFFWVPFNFTSFSVNGVALKASVPTASNMTVIFSIYVPSGADYDGLNNKVFDSGNLVVASTGGATSNITISVPITTIIPNGGFWIGLSLVAYTGTASSIYYATTNENNVNTQVVSSSNYAWVFKKLMNGVTLNNTIDFSTLTNVTNLYWGLGLKITNLQL